MRREPQACTRAIYRHEGYKQEDVATHKPLHHHFIDIAFSPDLSVSGPGKAVAMEGIGSHEETFISASFFFFFFCLFRKG